MVNKNGFKNQIIFLNGVGSSVGSRLRSVDPEEKPSRIESDLAAFKLLLPFPGMEEPEKKILSFLSNLIKHFFVTDAVPN